MIKEDFLYYLWKLRKFDMYDLHTTGGMKIEIEKFGDQNTGSGPDFSNAKVKIGDTLWYGNIEMHIFSSDWEKHSHHQDPSYNNVILHVVFENDQNIKTEAGYEIPCLELKHRIDKTDLKNYKLLRFNKNWIPCERFIRKTSEIAKTSALEKAVTERLSGKAAQLKLILDKNQNNWSESFYIFLSRYFGMNINADAFEMLAESCSLNLILRESDDLIKVEALLFGQAGFLNGEFKDEYPNRLKKEYRHLKAKYNLQHVPISVWKYSRLRPYNFPSIRIGQLANLIYRHPDFFEQTLKQKTTENLRKIFSSHVSEYWYDHFNFDLSAPKKKKSIGKSSIDILIINTVIPALFLYGHLFGSDEHKDLAINLLTEIPGEKNSITDKWQTLGFEINTAYDSQALLELKSHNCDLQKCLDCPVGYEIMKIT